MVSIRYRTQSEDPAYMEDGGVDRTIIDCRQHQLGQMADFPPLLKFLVFDLYKLDVPQIKSWTMRHTLLNLHMIKREHLCVCTNSCIYIRMSTMKPK
jgi:hypothetical protein